MPYMLCKVDYLPYNNAVHREGDTFFVEPQHVFLFLGEGRAKLVTHPDDQQPRRGRYRRTDVRAEDR